MSRALLLALQFLTRFPVRVEPAPQPVELADSACAYPWVGLLLGALLVLLGHLTGTIDPAPAAAVLVTAWTVASGALHVDGLADSADALVGGGGSRERTLEIMKDPASGPVGVAAVVCVLLLKYGALQGLIAAGEWGALVIAPLLGRAGMLALLLTTPYVRPQGLGQAIAEHLPHAAGWVSLGLALVPVVLLGGGAGLLVVMAVALGLMGLRAFLRERIGGLTGDTLGASCELVEAFSLVSLGLLLGSAAP